MSTDRIDDGTSGDGQAPEEERRQTDLPASIDELVRTFAEARQRPSFEVLLRCLKDVMDAPSTERRTLEAAWRDRAAQSGAYDLDDGNFGGWTKDDFQLVIDASKNLSKRPHAERTFEHLRRELRTLAHARGLLAPAAPVAVAPERKTAIRRLRDTLLRETRHRIAALLGWKKG